jgi:hypothetical protein
VGAGLTVREKNRKAPGSTRRRYPISVPEVWKMSGETEILLSTARQYRRLCERHPDEMDGRKLWAMARKIVLTTLRADWEIFKQMKHIEVKR